MCSPESSEELSSDRCLLTPPPPPLMEEEKEVVLPNIPWPLGRVPLLCRCGLGFTTGGDQACGGMDIGLAGLAFLAAVGGGTLALGFLSRVAVVVVVVGSDNFRFLMMSCMPFSVTSSLIPLSSLGRSSRMVFSADMSTIECRTGFRFTPGGCFGLGFGAGGGSDLPSFLTEFFFSSVLVLWTTGGGDFGTGPRSS